MLKWALPKKSPSGPVEKRNRKNLQQLGDFLGKAAQMYLSWSHVAFLREIFYQAARLRGGFSVALVSCRLAVAVSPTRLNKRLKCVTLGIIPNSSCTAKASSLRLALGF
jgi:hypothetical protein